MSQSSWGLSQRKCSTLIIGGHENTEKKKRKRKRTLKLFKIWHSHTCEETAITFGDDLVSSRNDHSHEVFSGQSDMRNSNSEEKTKHQNPASARKQQYNCKLPAILCGKKKLCN